VALDAGDVVVQLDVGYYGVALGVRHAGLGP